MLYLPGSGCYENPDRWHRGAWIPAAHDSGRRSRTSAADQRRQQIGGEMRLILITLALFLFWLALSGHYEPWFTVSGLVLGLGVVAFCRAKGIADAEGFPAGLLRRAVYYWPWLALQIVKSGMRVTRIVLDPKLPISPTLVRVDALQSTAVGLTTYGNSITLTPGTVTIEASERGRTLWVHAIERAGAEGFADDEMNRTVAWFEGTRA
jgi:multicomponent Na+:H+ antiporter subunit E